MACEQLLLARLRMEQRNALRIKRGQILTTLTMSLTCDHACEDAALTTIATDTPLHHDPDNLQLPYPFHQDHYPSSAPHELQSRGMEELPRSLPTWQLFASHVKTPSCWSINRPRPSNKMTKIPTPYHWPTLPKRWRYEDDEDEVKREILNNPESMHLVHPATTPHERQANKGSTCCSKHLKTSRSTRGTEQFPSPLPISLADQHPPDTSRFI